MGPQPASNEDIEVCGSTVATVPLRELPSLLVLLPRSSAGDTVSVLPGSRA